MCEVIKDAVVKARKNYRCDCIDQIRDYGDTEQEFGEKHECLHIKKGDKYYRQTQRFNGGIGDFKSCLPCHEFAKKHKIYQDNF